MKFLVEYMDNTTVCAIGLGISVALGLLTALRVKWTYIDRDLVGGEAVPALPAALFGLVSWIMYVNFMQPRVEIGVFGWIFQITLAVILGSCTLALWIKPTILFGDPKDGHLG